MRLSPAASVFQPCFIRGCLLVLWLSHSAVAAEREFQLETLRGKVVFLAEAFQRRAGVASVPEAQDRILAIETKGGELIPLLEDPRGRAFRSDERLRKMEIELLVRRYQATPARQIIRVFEVAEGGRLEIDYWCDVCAIVMYELKECECCQGPIELRRTKAK
jgi:hypothetical protein